jgi:ribosome-associated heat shock protein Hsp15
VSGQRLDKWLCFARLAKTRSLAAKLCLEGDVTLAGGGAPKPHHPVRIGDTITLRRGRLERRVTILALGARRGPAAEARLLYAEEPMSPTEEPWTPLIDVE